MDEAAAKLKMEITSKPEALDVVDRQVGARPASGSAFSSGYVHGVIMCACIEVMCADKHKHLYLIYLTYLSALHTQHWCAATKI